MMSDYVLEYTDSIDSDAEQVDEIGKQSIMRAEITLKEFRRVTESNVLPIVVRITRELVHLIFN